MRGRLSDNPLPSKIPPRAAPGVGSGAAPGLRGGAVSALVVVKGVNTRVPTINALRGPLRLADN